MQSPRWLCRERGWGWMDAGLEGLAARVPEMSRTAVSLHSDVSILNTAELYLKENPKQRYET